MVVSGTCAGANFPKRRFPGKRAPLTLRAWVTLISGNFGSLTPGCSDANFGYFAHWREIHAKSTQLHANAKRNNYENFDAPTWVVARNMPKTKAAA